MTNKKRIAKIFVALAAALVGLGATVLVSPSVLAEDDETLCLIDPSVCGGGGPTVENTVANIIQLALIAIGILAVIMIIFGGIRYATSRGEPKSVEAAKTTIIWAVVGLIVALLAYAIVALVMNSFENSGDGGGGGSNAHSCPSNMYWDTSRQQCVPMTNFPQAQ